MWTNKKKGYVAKRRYFGKGPIAAAPSRMQQLFTMPRPKYQALTPVQARAPEINSHDVNIVPPAGGTVLAWTSPPVGGEWNVAFAGITELNDVLQGAAYYNRIGAKIVMRSVELRLQLTNAVAPPYAAAGPLTFVRTMIVYDRQCNGAFPAIADLLSVNDSGLGYFSAGVNIANRSRFTVLRDQVDQLDYMSKNTVDIHMFVKCSLETQFKATAANIGDISTGAVYLVQFSETAGQFYFSGGTSRIRYLP